MLQPIFEAAAQADFDLGQPQQEAIGFPQTLAERYQPQRLTDFVALERPKRVLGKLLKAPRACNLLFVGPPGAGKTVMGLCYAAELPGSLHHIAAQKCDVATLDALATKFAYCQPVGNFWVCLVDEADQMTDKAQLQFLSRLDSTAALQPSFGGGLHVGAKPQVIWIFTCNGRGAQQTELPYTLLPRFHGRCLVVPFDAVPRFQLSTFLADIWKREDGPATPEGYFDYIAEGEGVRDALMRLEVDLLAGPRSRPIVEVAPAPGPARSQLVAPEVFAARSAAAMKAWATRRARK